MLINYYTYQKLLIIFLILSSNMVHSEIVEICYHKAYPSSQFDDSGMSTDQGGVALIIFRSESGSESIQNITLNGNDVDTLLVTPSPDDPVIDWYKYWPLTLTNSGDYGAVWIKAWDSPLKHGDTVSVSITTNYTTYSMSSVLHQPDLRLSYIAPSRDRTKIFLYLRNEGSVDYTVTGVYVDDEVSSDSYFMGSQDNIDIYSPAIGPGSVGIIEVKYPTPQEIMKLKCIRVTAEDSLSNSYTSGAAERIVPAQFISAIWQGSLGNADEDKVFAIENFRIDGNLQHSNVNALYSNYNIYKIETNTSYSNILSQANNPAIGAWDLAEEPGDRSEIQGIIDQGNYAWQHAPSKPTYVNLMQNQKFGWYAPLADIAGMDHYVFFAPNAYSSLYHDFDEAYEYARSIKLTAEPKPVWNWTQVTAYDFPTFGVNIQAWANIMYGAKGVLWWDYGSDEENDSEHGDQVYEAAAVMRQMNQISGIIQYSDYANIVSSANNDIRTSALIGHEAMIVLVASDDYDMSWSWDHLMSCPSNMKRETGTVSFDVPGWINPQAVKEVTESGLTDPTFSVAGQTISVDFDVEDKCAVYLIGKTDTQPPTSPTNIKIADTVAEGSILVWDDSFDNYGVKEYIVYKNNDYYTTSNGTVIVDPDYSFSHIYKVQAVDAFGNISQAAYFDNVKPTASITIEQGDQLTFDRNVELEISASDIGSGISQMRFYNGSWTPWMPYSTSFNIDLPSDNYGLQFIYAQLKDNNGNISSANSDYITYTLKGDFDGDLDVDFNDLLTLSTYWLNDCSIQDCSYTDINQDDFINFKDYAETADNW